MPARKTLALAVGGAALVAAAGAATAGALGDDPDGTVEAVEVGRLTDAPATTATTAGSPATTRGTGSLGATTSTTAGVAVPGLTELSGPVTQAPDDDGFDDLVVEGYELDFGPDEWTATIGPTQDFDGDGTAEALRDEVAGLRGTDTTFAVRLDDSGGEAEVYLIGGLTYRNPAGPAPWDPAGGTGGGSDDGAGDDDGGGTSGGPAEAGDDDGGDDDRDDRVEPGDDRD
jgi:hypothetical protein